MYKKTNKSLNIFLGPYGIGAICGNLSEVFRSMGHKTTTVILQEYDLPEGLVYDINLHFERKNKIQKWLSQVIIFLKSVFKYDLYIFLYGHSLLPRNLDLPILHLLRKNTIMWFLGSDIRNTAAVEKFIHDNNITLQQNPLRKNYERNIDDINRMLRRVEKNVSYIITGISIGQLIKIDYIGKDIKNKICLPINISSIKHNTTPHDTPTIIHAPSKDDIKGTSLILEAINKIKDEGYNFEFKIYRNLEHNQLLKKLSDANIAIDQLYAGGPGMFAIEAMAAGCAVLGGNIPEYSGAPEGSPIIHTTPDNVYNNLIMLLKDPSICVKLGNEGRRYVESNYSHEIVAKKVLKLFYKE